MEIFLDLFPGGKKKALTMSYDDGKADDIKLVGIFNKYGIKGTFHLCSGLLDQDGFVKSADVKSLYAGHEISSHTVNHPNLVNIPLESAVREIIEDRKSLEELAGYPVRGMSYPYGAYNSATDSLVKSLGMDYARTVRPTGRFIAPDDFCLWDPTCHHRDNLLETGRKFLEFNRKGFLSVMYVWGHSYEFDMNGNWSLMEDFCREMSGADNIWYATNIEIVDYVRAVRALKFTVEGNIVYNPSAVPVWITAGDEPVAVMPGEYKHLREGLAREV